jgi:hypothetical protein
VEVLGLAHLDPLEVPHRPHGKLRSAASG